MTDAGTATEELALMLMYLCRQKDEKKGADDSRWLSWKSYEWVTIDALERSGLVTDSGKTVTFSEKGMEEAEKLLEKYGIEDWPPIGKDGN